MRKLKPTIAVKLADKLAAKARDALAQVELLTERIESSIPLCREAWRDYGQALLSYRDTLPEEVQMGMRQPNTQAFGRWVRRHNLNVGLAKSASVRSNAIWVATNWPELQRCKALVTAHHPTAIRRQWLALQKSWERESRIFLDGLPHEVNWPAETIHMASGVVASVANGILREALITSEDVETLKSSLAEVNAAVDKLLRYVADHPEVLSAEPHKVE